MATLNKPTRNERTTHEGAMAHPINPEQELRRSVMACMLWEKQFYEDGESIADRIKGLIVAMCKAGKEQVVADIAREARNEQNLRHVPLLVARELALHGYQGTANLLADIIQRPDELTEFMAIYWADGKTPVSAQVKKGLAKAFVKFNSYQLGKYNRPKAIKLRDVLFISHAKPKDTEQADMWKRLVDGTLEVPDTWEVALSTGQDKKETWTRLIESKKLGGLAMLRNLRNMQEADVPEATIKKGIAGMNASRVLPFRFIAAAKFGPRFEPELEAAMFRSIETKLDGRTVVLVDGSGSMNGDISAKSDMTRFEAACALAMIAREIFADTLVFVFSNQVSEVAPRRGFALRDAVTAAAVFRGTDLRGAVEAINGAGEYDRIIVITDEQSYNRPGAPTGKGYMINVASYQNGVGYGPWTHIDGWSEAVFKYIVAIEQ